MQTLIEFMPAGLTLKWAERQLRPTKMGGADLLVSPDISPSGAPINFNVPILNTGIKRVVLTDKKSAAGRSARLGG
jgi:hypothetical protein